MLRAQWAWCYRMRANPRIESADQDPTSPRGRRSHDLTVADVPSWPRPGWPRSAVRSGLVVGLWGRLNFLCADQSHAPGGTLAIAAHGVVPQFVLAEALPRFHARYPEVRVELLDAGSSRDLARLGTDALLQFGWPPEQDAILRTLAETRWLIAATPAYWARHGVPAHPSDLARCPCALYKTPSGEVMRRWAFERGGERVDVGVDGWLASDSRSALDAPLYSGQLAARINDLTAHPGLADGTLQPVLLDWHALNAPPLSLLVRRSLARQPRMRAWVDFLVETAERLTRPRLPAGLPPVPVSTRPDWWRRRVAAASRRAVAAAGR